MTSPKLYKALENFIKMNMAILFYVPYLRHYSNQRTLFENESIIDINYPDLLAPDSG